MSKTILIVEDEEAIQQLLSDIFGFPEDYSILFSRDGEEALRTARDHNPDVVLLDVQIPKINGFEVCRLIKSDPLMSQTKVIMLSGMVQQTDSQQAQDSGADEFIAKPFNTDVLIKKVEQYLSKP